MFCGATKFPSGQHRMMNQKGNTLDHNFYVVVGKQCRTENAYAGHQHIILI